MKPRFQKERKDFLDGQGGSEQVADESRINSPVRAELEFHDDSRRHTHRKTDRVQRCPESRGCFIEVRVSRDTFLPDTPEQRPMVSGGNM